MLQYVKYKGKDVPLVVDIGSMTKVCARLGLKLSEFDESKVFDIAGNGLIFIEECLKRAYRIEEKEWDLKEVDVENIYVEYLSKGIGKLNEAMPSKKESKKK